VLGHKKAKKESFAIKKELQKKRKLILPIAMAVERNEGGVWI